MTQNGDTHPSQNLNLKKRIHFLHDFSNLNNELKRKIYPIPKINANELKLEGYQYDTSIYLDTVYYHIQITEYASNLCTIIIPWGNTVINVCQQE